MQPNTRNRKKNVSTDKPATIVIDVPGAGTKTIEAQHYIKNDSDGSISIYTGDRSDGIDVQTHISRCVIDRVGTHGDSQDGESERSLVADGGRDCRVSVDGTPVREDEVIKQLNILRYEVVEVEIPIIDLTDYHPRDDDRTLICFGHKGAVDPSYIDPRALHRCRDCGVLMTFGTAWCIDCSRSRRESRTFLDDDGDDGDDDKKLVTDGGTDVAPGDCGCECCEMGDERAYDVPSSDEFSEMMEVVEESGITAGDLVSGTEVLHAGEQYRVARVGTSSVEIYQLGHGSRIVPIDAVEPVLEVQG